MTDLQPTITNGHGQYGESTLEAESTFSSSTLTVAAETLSKSEIVHPTPNSKSIRRLERLLLKQDHRARLPSHLSRFLGYRSQTSTGYFDPFPVPPFKWLSRIPIRYESWLFATMGSFISILSIEAMMTTHTAFHIAYRAPIIVSSFGASAVIIFGVPDAPFAQPRNAVLGQTISAIVAVAITRLWLLMHPDYTDHLNSTADFYSPSFINGALCMTLALLVQLMFGVVYPPGGATALAAATDAGIVTLSWHYVPVVLVSSLVMVGVGILNNNLGRRRYPTHWWAPGKTFVREVEAQLKELDAEAVM